MSTMAAALLSTNPSPTPNRRSALLLLPRRLTPAAAGFIHRAVASASFPGARRADWQASFSILSSQAAAAAAAAAGGGGASLGSSYEKPTNDSGDPSEAERGDSDKRSLPAPVNGTMASVKSLVSSAAAGGADLAQIPNLPRPLSIGDLSPAPMHGSRLRVAYQGVPGAYSEAAAGKAYPNCEPIPCDQFEVAFQAVELWIADRAVLPVENSLGGSIHRNYDLLLRHRLHIVGEVQLPVHHCLLALPGVRKEYLTRVMSHPQALAQCELTLTRLGLNVTRESFDDTAGAAEYVANNGLRDTAAIASARAAELYGLQVLADGIQDDSGNVTRFVMLAREPIIPRTDRPYKTSIVFAHDREGTSVLFKVLSAFAFRDISLTKIESRPHRHRPIRLVDDANVGTAKHFEYMFHVDFQASMAETRAQNALAEIQEFTSFLRVLGSYPMDMTPWSTSPSTSTSPPPPPPSSGPSS